MHLTTQERYWIVELIEAYMEDRVPGHPHDSVDIPLLRGHVRPDPASVMREALEFIAETKLQAPSHLRDLAISALRRANESEDTHG